MSRGLLRRTAAALLLVLPALALAPAAEAQRPATPAGFTATASTTDLAVTLSWNANTNPNAVGETITGFRIDWRLGSKSGDWNGANVQDGSRTIMDGAATSLTLTVAEDGLQPGVEYDFRIRSIRSGTGDTTSWFTGNDALSERVPADRPTNFKAERTDPRTITVSWGEPTTAADPPGWEYQLEYTATDGRTQTSGILGGARSVDYNTGILGWRFRVRGVWASDNSMTTEWASLTVPNSLDDVPRTYTASGPATGAPSISGEARAGQALTAGAGTIADDDGLTGVSYSWQWVRVGSGGAENDISGATGDTYTPGAADIGRTLKVRADFTDDAGNSESRTSAATATVVSATAPAALRFATTPSRLTEDNVDGATVTVRLLGATWVDPALIRVTGLPPGMTAGGAVRRSDGEARITLSYTPPEGVDGLEGDAVLTVTAAAASHSWTGDLTARVTVHARSAPAALAAVRWLSRFGRTVADHVMAAVGARLAEPAGQGDRLRLAGHRVGAGPPFDRLRTGFRYAPADAVATQDEGWRQADGGVVEEHVTPDPIHCCPV